MFFPIISQAMPSEGWTDAQVAQALLDFAEIRNELDNVQIQQVRQITEQQEHFDLFFEILQPLFIIALLMLLFKAYMVARKG